MKFPLIIAFFLFSALVNADPPVFPPPVKEDPPVPVIVFCFRITDIREDCEVPNRFFFEFEILNWSDAHAGGVEIAFAHDSHRDLVFGTETTFSGVDSDGRPLIPEDTNGDGNIDAADNEDDSGNGLLDAGEDHNGNERLDNDPAPGNLPTDNTWTLANQTASKMVWTMGDSRQALPFINLFDSGGDLLCIPNTMGRTADSNGVITPTEAIDNGVNVKDGFVMTIDNFEPGRVAQVNWFLTGAGGATAPPQTGVLSSCTTSNNDPVGLGTVISNAYGSGLLSIARDINGTFPDPTFDGQTGFAQETRDFFDSVYNVPNCKDKPSVGDDANTMKDAVFAIEFSPQITAGFCNGNDAPPGARPPNAVASSVNTNCGGDPHFMTWDKKRFNYHGECDLVLAHSETFQDGKGLDVHVRTKIVDFGVYSLVSAAAIRLDNAVFEFNHESVGEPKYFVNGIEEKLPFANDLFKVTTYSVHSEEHNKSAQIVEVDLGSNSKVVIDVMDQWVMVNIHARGKDVVGSTGLSGSYPSGRMLGRDGVTDLSHDRNAYGSEWQVQPDEPQLFRSTPEGHPQAPYAACKLPDIDAHQFLRTRDSSMYRRALEACKKQGVTKQDLEDCVFDVSILNNPKIAAAWWGKEQAEEN